MQPKGPTQTKWYAGGYQAALADLASKFHTGGEAEARAWIKSNLIRTDARCAGCGVVCEWSIDAWVCTGCGSEWYPDHGAEFAPPEWEPGKR